jgi:hypothetical protein
MPAINLAAGLDGPDQNHLIRMIKDENPIDEKPLRKLRLRWEDVIIKYVEALNGG